MRTPRILVILVAALLVVALAPVRAVATTKTKQDTEDFDVLHRDIDIKSLTLSYSGRGAKATVRFKNLQKKKRLRIFVAFINQTDPGPYSSWYGNFVELRIDEHRKVKVKNWIQNPDLYDDYHLEKCRGIKVKADFKKDKITYKVPPKCARFLKTKGYVDSYVSARKYRAKHWDDGSPADSTGDWFDTTPDLAVEE